MPSWRACSPTASSRRARSGGRRASSAASLRAGCEMSTAGSGPRFAATRYVNAESTLDRRSGRSLRSGHPAMTSANGAPGRCRDRRRRHRRGVRLLLDASRLAGHLDRARHSGSGSSHGNCGLICPSHVLPLAEPGMVSKGIKSLFRATRRLRSSRGSTRPSGRGCCTSPVAATSAT